MNRIAIQILRVLLVGGIISGPVLAGELKPPLNSAEDALAYFREATIPVLEKAVDGDGRNPVTAIRRMTWTIRCGRVKPEDIKNFAESHGVRWPEDHYPILAGSKDQVQQSKADTWVIHYSTGIANSMYAYLDAVTGDTLLVFIIPEG